MIQVRHMTSADEIFASAKRLKDVFFNPRPIVRTQVPSTAERADTEIIGAETPESSAGSDSLLSQAAAPGGNAFLFALLLGMALGRTQEDEPEDFKADQIRLEVQKEFGINRTEMNSERRSVKIVIARQALMHLLRKHTTLSMPAIGRYLGDKDHTTVLHGDMRCIRRMEEDPEHGKRVRRIEARIKRRAA